MNTTKSICIVGLLLVIIISCLSVQELFANYSGSITPDNGGLYQETINFPEDTIVELEAHYNPSLISIVVVRIREIPTEEGQTADSLMADINGVWPGDKIGPRGIAKGTYLLEVYGGAKQGTNGGTFTLVTHNRTPQYINDREPNDSFGTAQSIFNTTSGHLGFFETSPANNYVAIDSSDFLKTYIMKGEIYIDFEIEEDVNPYSCYFYRGTDLSPSFGTIFSPGVTKKTIGPFEIDSGSDYTIYITNAWQYGKWGAYAFNIEYTELDQAAEPPRVYTAGTLQNLESFVPKGSIQIFICLSEECDPLSIKSHINVTDDFSENIPIKEITCFTNTMNHIVFHYVYIEIESKWLKSYSSYDVNLDGIVDLQGNPTPSGEKFKFQTGEKKFNLITHILNLLLSQ